MSRLSNLVLDPRAPAPYLTPESSGLDISHERRSASDMVVSRDPRDRGTPHAPFEDELYLYPGQR